MILKLFYFCGSEFTTLQDVSIWIVTVIMNNEACFRDPWQYIVYNNLPHVLFNSLFSEEWGKNILLTWSASRMLCEFTKKLDQLLWYLV